MVQVRDVENETSTRTIEMRQLRVGDYVRAKDGEWDKVFFIKHRTGHIRHLQLFFDFDDEAVLTVTPIHLLYVGAMNEENLKPAKDVRVGDVLFVLREDEDVDGGEEAFVAREVVFIGEVFEGETFAPVTMSGSLVVSRVLASSFGGSTAKRHSEYYIATAPFRFVSEFVSETFAAQLTAFNYYLFFELLDAYDMQFAVYNAYSGPFVVGLPLVVPLVLAAKWLSRR